MIWAAERNTQQGRLIAGFLQAAVDVPREQRAVIAGGLPGAAKDAALGQHGIDRSRYLVLSIDAVLADMAARGLIAVAPGRSPLAGAGDVHAEAQHVAKRIALVAVNDGRNVLLDVTVASRPATEAWAYALRFADYAVTAVFADIAIEDSVAWAAAARQRGEEAYARGHGHGGRLIPAAAIRALASPAIAQARNSISWASGAEPASVTAGSTPGTGLAGGAVTAMIDAYRRGERDLDDLGLEFRARRWPLVPPVCPPGLEQAEAAIDDIEPYVPGSFDDVILAYDLGRLNDAEYEFLAGAAACSVGG